MKSFYRRLPFYVESGGQVSDTGILRGDDWVIEVEDIKKPVSGLVIHVGEVTEGNPKTGDTVQTEVDLARRGNITRNHTGTHLLHAALRNTLGTHVQQRGSLVAPDRLRFDFSHDEKVSHEQLRSIEAQVNDAILRNYSVKIDHKSLNVARAEGAMALFGEKYDDVVRTVILEDDNDRYSYELCGGIHVNETAEIGGFLFTNESAVSAGVRRVEALTGQEAVRYMQQQLQTLQTASAQLGTTPDQLATRIESLQQEVAERKKEVSQLRSRLAKHEFDSMIDNMETINNVPALIAKLEDVPMDTMRQMSDWFRNKADSGVMILASDVDSKPQVMIAVTDDLTSKGIHAGKLIKEVASVVGGGGGGRPNLAQAGGKDSTKIPEALNKARELLAEG